MSKSLAKIGTEVSKETWNAEQVQLIKNTVAKGATDDELKLFLYTAKRTGLDPLTKQIHFVKRGFQMTVQTGIDGYRAIAERTGQLGGIDDAVYDTDNSDDPLVEHPNKASVTVYRFVNGQRVSFTASARWTEYAPNDKMGFMWKKMPYLMLGKCAEALALRKAFPNDLTGLYTNEEMQQADSPVETQPKPSYTSKSQEPEVQEEYKDIMQVAKELGDRIVPEEIVSTPEEIKIVAPKKISDKAKITHLCGLLNIDVANDDAKDRVRALTGLEVKKENYEEIISRMEALVKERAEAKK